MTTEPLEKSLEDLLENFDCFNKSTVKRVLFTEIPLISIVMLSWKRWNVFMDTMDHIISRQTTPMNISLTVQECSNQVERRNVMMKLGEFNDSIVRFTRKNQGTGKPRHDTIHRALDKFDTPYIHFTDDDMRLPRFAQELMVSILEDRPEYGAINIKTNPNSNIWIMNELNELEAIKPDPYKNFNDSLALGSATMVIRREVFETCDYDKHYFIGCADIDLGMQMAKAGWKCGMITIPGWHAANIKGGEEAYEKVRYNEKTIEKSIERFKEKWGYEL